MHVRSVSSSGNLVDCVSCLGCYHCATTALPVFLLCSRRAKQEADGKQYQLPVYICNVQRFVKCITGLQNRNF